MEKIVSQLESSSENSIISNDINGEWKVIELFATSDCHSHFDPTEHVQYHVDEPARAGGMAKRSTFLSQRRADASKPPIGVFDCGDALMGTIFFDLFRGEAELRSLKKLGYNAICCGNHDWDGGIQNYLNSLMKATSNSGPPMSILCGNLTYEGEYKSDFDGLFRRYDILKVGETKVGIFGVIGFLAFDCIAPKSREGLTFVSLEDSYLAIVQELRELDCDIVVCLSHAGFEDDSILVQLDNGADVIFGGHSHKKYKAKAEIVTSSGPAKSKVIWHQAPPLGVAFARITLRVKVKSNSIIGASAVAEDGISVDLIDSGLDFIDESIPDDPEYSQWLEDNYRKEVRAIGEVALGHCSVDWLTVNPKQHSLLFAGLSPLGRFLAQFVADFYGCEVGILNRGGIKAGFMEGLVTQNDVSTVFGNNDSILKVDMKGCRLRVLCEYSNNFTNPDDIANNVRNEFKNNGLQFSPSVKLFVDNSPSCPSVQVMVNGKPINDNDWYTVAINDYTLISRLLNNEWFIPRGLHLDQFLRIHERTTEKQEKWQQTFAKFLKEKLHGNLSNDELFRFCPDIEEYSRIFLDDTYVSTFVIV